MPPHDPLPIDEYTAWIPQARPLSPFLCDAVFRIEPSFTIGPDSGITGLDWHSANVTLPPLDLPRRRTDQVTTAEALNHEAPLIAYYRNLVALAAQHGKPTALQPFPYFRTQPAIIANGDVLTQLSWNDDIHETQTILEALAESNTGPPRMLHDDEDQGWHILIATTGATACFLEWDAEGPPPTTGGYALDAASVATQATAALDRLQTVHTRLVHALGQDYWTYRHPPRPPPPITPIRAAIRRLNIFTPRARR